MATVSVAALATGVLASVLALAQVFAWLAAGSPFVRRLGSTVAAPVALLVGSAITGAAYAVLAAAGEVDAAMVVIPAASVLVATAWRRQAWELCRSLVDQHRRMWGRATPVAVAAMALLWSIAISPPRDADVLRYHLAHVRQIDREGRWVSIPDWHDALPFGWSMNSLPFVHIGLPEVAHLVNLLAFLVAIATLGELLRRSAGGTVAAAGCALLGLHPLIVKSATTAHLDVYLLLVVVTALALAAGMAVGGGAASLGFACWVGAQSRYQLIAVGVVGTAWVLAVAVRTGRFQLLRRFAAGAAAGLVLAAPFSVKNLWAFGNPVWPLLARRSGGADGYADRVAAAHNELLNGTWSLHTVAEGVHRVFTDWPVAPLPVVVVGAAIAWPWVDRRVRFYGLFVVGLLVLWVATQPALFPRNVLVAVPAALVVAADLWRRLPATGVVRRLGVVLVGVALVGLLAVDLVYSGDSLVYAASANEARFHRYTWFHDVYTWANDTTPPDARFLVIVESAQTYELDRFYRRADPTYAGVVDWSAMGSATDLERRLAGLEMDYIVLHRTDWGPYPGGGRMMAAIDAGRRCGLLRTVRSFSSPLTRSRIRREVVRERVDVLSIEHGRSCDRPVPGQRG